MKIHNKYKIMKKNDRKPSHTKFIQKLIFHRLKTPNFQYSRFTIIFKSKTRK